MSSTKPTLFALVMVACLGGSVGCAAEAQPAEETSAAESALTLPGKVIVPLTRYATTGFYFDWASLPLSGVSDMAMLCNSPGDIIHSGSMTRFDAGTLVVADESRSTNGRPLTVITNYGTNPASFKATVPGSFAARTRAAGLAAGDLDRNGKQDLLLFTADQYNQVDQSSGSYRIGWDFDPTTGNARWSDRITIPGWSQAGVNGGGAALGDVDRDGKLDLITFFVADPGGENVGYYKIGWDVGANGSAQGWTGFQSMGNAWFGANGVGTGIAAADLDQNGKLDLVVTHFDQGDNVCDCGWSFPAGGNCDNCHYGWSIPYYRIVHDLSTARSDAGLAASIGDPVLASNSYGAGYGYTEAGGVAIVSRVVGTYSDLLFRTGHGSIAIGHGFGYTF